MDVYNDYKASLGERIREKREAAGISLRRFSLMIGVHRNYMVDIELGRANPSLDILFKISEGLDTTIWELLDPMK